MVVTEKKCDSGWSVLGSLLANIPLSLRYAPSTGGALSQSV